MFVFAERGKKNGNLLFIHCEGCVLVLVMDGILKKHQNGTSLLHTTIDLTLYNCQLIVSLYSGKNCPDLLDDFKTWLWKSQRFCFVRIPHGHAKLTHTIVPSLLLFALGLSLDLMYFHSSLGNTCISRLLFASRCHPPNHKKGVTLLRHSQPWLCTIPDLLGLTPPEIMLRIIKATVLPLINRQSLHLVI